MGEETVIQYMFIFLLSCGQTVDKNILPVHQTACDAEVKQKTDGPNLTG